jgi:hypothetical protein
LQSWRPVRRVAELGSLGIMRVLSYILIIAGLCLLVRAGYQQYRGVTDDPIDISGDINRTKSSESFRGAIKSHWVSAGLTLFSGIVLYLIIRRQERLDPLSPDSHRKDYDA